MRIPGRRRLTHSGRWLKSRFVDSALILGYHRVAEAAHDPFALCVTPQHFAEQMEVLRQHANPISLAALVRHLHNGRLPPRAVAVTFDDGYADVLENAKPVLERCALPATVFIVTGFLGQEFWWDELHRILRDSQELPDRLCLTVGQNSYEWRLGANSNGQDLQQSLLAITDVLRPLPGDERQRLMDQIRAWSGVNPNQRVVSRSLRPGELCALVKEGRFEVGLHTATHADLAALPPSAQRNEVQKGKDDLERVIDRPVRGFSYPNGSLSSETRAIVQDAGFYYACASHNDIAWRASDPFYLPRFWIPDIDGKQFRRWLKTWL